jgi:DNA-binding MarR family transcriptional regulator
MSQANDLIGTIHEIRDSCLCLATQRAARILARQFDAVFAPLGITNGQFSMMCALMGTWGPKLSDLAGFLAMDQTTISTAVRTLERKGMLVLEQDADDGRVWRPRLTEAGRAVVVQAIPLWKAEHAALEAEVTGDARELARVLSQLG